jgi:NTE family protein
LFGGSTIGPTLDFPYQFHLGSMGRQYINNIQPFIGYRFLEISGRNNVTARGDLLYQFFKNHYLIARYNLGKLEPTLDDLFASDILLDGYSLGYSYNSPIGPLEFNVASSSNHSNFYTYVSLGFWF